jgi:integrase
MAKHLFQRERDRAHSNTAREIESGQAHPAMTPRVYELLKARHNACGRPTAGWVFPRLSSKWKLKTGKARRFEHFSGDAAKEQHKKALADSGVEPFEFVPYTLRHTALTNLGEAAGGDVFVQARIAGHSTITVTQRYIHPQAAAINRVFAASQSLVGTKLGTPKKLPKANRRKNPTALLAVNH